MDWEKFGSAVSANIPASQFSISHELRKLTIQAEVRFKNPNFQFFCELEKNWKYSMSPRIKCPNFESVDE